MGNVATPMLHVRAKGWLLSVVNSGSHRQCRHAMAEPFGSAQRSFHGGVGKNQCKFLPAIAGGKIARPRHATPGRLLTIQQPTQFSQDLIAPRMAVHIVDVLEIVEIDEEERQWTHGPERKRA